MSTFSEGAPARPGTRAAAVTEGFAHAEAALARDPLGIAALTTRRGALWTLRDYFESAAEYLLKQARRPARLLCRSAAAQSAATLQRSLQQRCSAVCLVKQRCQRLSANRAHACC